MAGPILFSFTLFLFSLFYYSPYDFSFVSTRFIYFSSVLRTEMSVRVILLSSHVPVLVIGWVIELLANQIFCVT